MKSRENGNMKTVRNLIVAASVAILSLAGCQEEVFNEPIGSDNYYAATEVFSADTKTALGQGRSAVWLSGDQIAVFEGSSVGKAYQVTDAAVGSGTGEFTLVKDLCTDATSNTESYTIAVYPFNKSLKVSVPQSEYFYTNAFEITGITFPSRQTYTSGSFSDEAFPMTAITQKGVKSLPFKNIGGVIKLSLTGTSAVSEVTINGNDDEPLSGSATVSLNLASFSPDYEVNPYVIMSAGASKSVTLICDPAVQLDSEKATDFFISIPPTNFKSGFTVTITDSDGKESTKSTTKAHRVPRSTILTMPGFSQYEMEEVTYTISEIAEDVVNINEYVSPIFSESENIEQLAGHLESIRRMEGVKDAWTTSTSLFILTKAGLTLSWTYTLQESYEDSPETQAAQQSVMQPIARSTATRAISYEEHNSSHDYQHVCIINQQYNDESRKGYTTIYDKLANDFENNGFGKVKRINGGEADLAFFENDLTDYDIIFLITHGAYDDRGNHWIATGEEVKNTTQAKIDSLLKVWNKGKEEAHPADFYGIGLCNIKEKRGKTTTINYIKVSEDYIAYKMTGRFKNAIIFNTACESLKGNNRLELAVRGKGAAAYLGYDEVNDKGKIAGPEFFNNMINGMTIEEAYNSLSEDYKKEQVWGAIFYHYANLEYKPTNCKDICIAHLTPETRDTTMVNGNVRLNGTFKTPIKGYHIGCNLGFCYSDSNSEPTIENSETVFVENGNDPVTAGTVYCADLSDIKFNTTYYYRFFFQNPHSKEYVYGDTKSFELEMDQWVDLGLPSGTLWAAWNVGANSPEEYGGYYAWGETEEKSSYTYDNYKFENPSTGDYDFIGEEISGTSYDVAHVKWGGGARMPTIDEGEELGKHCTLKKSTYNGVKGVYLTGPNGNSIFLPYAGCWFYDHIDYKGDCVILWSGTLYKDKYGSRCAYTITGGSSNMYYYRIHGHPVRPVKAK